MPGGVGAGGLRQGEVAGVHAEGDEEVDEDGEVEGPGAGDHLPQPSPGVRQLLLQGGWLTDNKTSSSSLSCLESLSTMAVAE